MKPVLRLLLASGLALALGGPARGDAGPPRDRVRRFALVASSNDGGSGRPLLRFANSDAEGMAAVLHHLGGLAPADLILLRDTNRTRLRDGFERMKALLASARRSDQRRELFVYYSGHSDENGLLLGPERVEYRELRRWIDESGAEVRIAVFDSCASGALLRLKGGRRLPPFLGDVSTDARGHAFLTASSADEAAQESDRVGGAFFTHYLVSGLRGAADLSHDGRVTLAEAYQFAYDETLRRTESSQAGAQHAAYDIQLVGIGDLVMTDLRATDASLVLDEKLTGRFFVRDQDGRLLVELRKEPVYPVELGLGPGRYRVVQDADGRPFEANIELRSGQRTRLGQAQLTPLAPLAAAARGDVRTVPAASIEAAAPAPGAYEDVPFDLMLVPGVRMHRSARPMRNQLVLGVVSQSDALRGVQLSLAANIVDHEMEGVQLSSGANVARGPGHGLQSAPVNVALDRFRGMQLGAGFNVALGAFRGLQLGTVNYASGETSGAQIGVVNVATGPVDGGQIAVVNVARQVHGTQIGVVNVADDVDGESVGLVSWVRTGYHPVALWASDTSFGNLGIKLGSRHLYTLFGAGITVLDRDDRARAYAGHFGVGGHFVPFGGRLFLDVDLLASSIQREPSGDQTSLLTALRLQVGWQLASHMALVGGPTLNLMTSWSGQDQRVGLGVAEGVHHDGDVTLRLFPGLTLGLQI